MKQTRKLTALSPKYPQNPSFNVYPYHTFNPSSAATKKTNPLARGKPAGLCLF